MFERIVFSLMIWSTCLSRSISAFFSILRATKSPAVLCLASLTLPNEPVPKVYIMS